MCSCGSKRSDAVPPVRLERMTYWDGQTLRSADLNDIVKIADARRWWHNRALHNAYGISFGLEVTPVMVNSSTPNPVPGVRVSAGIAYDRFGRMLYQQFDLDLPFPSDATDPNSPVVLLLRWPEVEAEACCCCAPAPKCCLGEPVRRADGIEFYWKDNLKVQTQDGIPVARAFPSKDPKNTPAMLDKKFLSPRLRRFQRPHIVGNGTLPGATSWNLGPADLVYPDRQDTSISWQPVDVYIDSSAAAFSQTPNYVAILSGPLFDVSRQLLLPINFPHIADEFPDRFTFRFWIPINVDTTGEAQVTSAATPTTTGPNNVIGFDAFRAFARQQKLHVVWVGCETPAPGVAIDRKQLARKLCGCGTPETRLSV
jgi:hypothetical protein